MKATAPRGWQRPVRRSDVVWVMSSAALLWLGLVAGVAWSAREHLQSFVTLHDQGLSLRLPEGMPARAEVRTPLFTSMDLRFKVAVPINQAVSVQLTQNLSAHVVINTTVPVETAIDFDAEVPVSTELEMKIPVVSWLPAMDVKVPVSISVPVHMNVPIKVQFPVALAMVVSGQVTDAVKVPVRTTMHLSVPVHAKLRADVLSLADFNLIGLQAPFGLRINQIEVRTPLREIGWCLGLSCVPDRR